MFIYEAFFIAGLLQTLPLHTCREGLSASCLTQEHVQEDLLAWGSARQFSFTMNPIGCRNGHVYLCTQRLTKSPSLVLIRLVTEIQPFKNVKINKEM